jgi:hypothetical protein
LRGSFEIQNGNILNSELCTNFYIYITITKSSEPWKHKLFNAFICSDIYTPLFSHL